MKKFFSTLFIVFALFLAVYPQQYDPFVPVVIDTDCGLDDLRSLCMLLSVRELEILSVTASDGALSPAEGGDKIRQLLNNAGIRNIPTGIGRTSELPPPEWRDYSRSITWGEKFPAGANGIAGEVICEQIGKSAQKIRILCLGPMTNICDALKKMPVIKDKIEKIVWYSNGNPLAGSNYERDKDAADYVISLGITIDVIFNLDSDFFIIDNHYVDSVHHITAPFAKVISTAHSNPQVQRRILEKHLRFWDDLLPVFLLYPEFFDMKDDLQIPTIRYVTHIESGFVMDKMYAILAQQYATEKNILFETFPCHPKDYRSDIREAMEQIISRYGREEWRLCVLTGEIHGHLGIYSVVGAKMGLKAREVLGAGIDRMDVYSYAGSTPPLSCLNDGLQISTGATLGQGTIEVNKDTLLFARAVFRYNNKKVRISLKPEYEEQIRKDISAGIVNYGNLTDGYWTMIRKLSLVYWLEWDRNEIFFVQEIP